MLAVLRLLRFDRLRAVSRSALLAALSLSKGNVERRFFAATNFAENGHKEAQDAQEEDSVGCWRRPVLRPLAVAQDGILRYLLSCAFCATLRAYLSPLNLARANKALARSLDFL